MKIKPLIARLYIYIVIRKGWFSQRLKIHKTPNGATSFGYGPLPIAIKRIKMLIKSYHPS